MLCSTKTNGDWQVMSDELIDIVNGLSNDDVAKILDCFSSRVIVWIDHEDGKKAMDVESATLNGTFIQINLKDE
jgi:hypothetical protein